MRKITDIYTEYNIMPNLALHQLRVAAVAKKICESLDREIDTNDVVIACLIHDMGNIIKFKLDYFPQFVEPLGLDYWLDVQNEYFEKYGHNEHAASIAIAKELGVSSTVADLVKCIDSTYIEKIATGDNFAEKICMYSDDRVTPFGIVSVQQRNLEAKERYKDRPNAFDEEKRNFFMNNVLSMQVQIFSHSCITPEDITDESVASDIELLKNFEI